MCQKFGVMYAKGGFEDQPAWFVNTYMVYLAAKNKAEKALEKKRQSN